MSIKHEGNQITVGGDQLIGGHSSHSISGIRVSEELVVEGESHEFETHQNPSDVFTEVQEEQTFLIHGEG